MIPITCGYARVSKTGDFARSLNTKLHITQLFGIREECILLEETTGKFVSRRAWDQPIVWAWPQRHNRRLTGPGIGNFDQDVKIETGSVSSAAVRGDTLAGPSCWDII